MEIIRCENGHFYDSSKYRECPYCNATSDTVPVTEPAELPEDDTTQAYFDWENLAAVSPERKRIKGPVVGWVVATDGANKGMDFPLKSGKNFVGRGESMDVCLREDKTVSRERHAVIVYDPKSNRFLVQPGDAAELFYLNDELVLAAQPLNPYDVITIGKTHLVFVPLCNERFQWTNDSEKAPENPAEASAEAAN